MDNKKGTKQKHNILKTPAQELKQKKLANALKENLLRRKQSTLKRNKN